MANFTLFADDTTLNFAGGNYDNIVGEANVHLSSVHQWTIDNRLKLNPQKTSALLFTNRRTDVDRPLVSLSHTTLPYVNHVKFLGLYLDRRLNFSVHIDSVASKLSKISGILFSIRNYAPECVLMNLYYSLVFPHLIYGVLLWGGAAKVHLEPLILMQKRIVRILT